METRVQEQTFLGILSVYGENTSLEWKTETCLPHQVIVRIKNIWKVLVSSKDIYGIEWLYYYFLLP